tara:strand:+ start:5383 stop:9447 length:4065 start_codon:yes stop_codon:yes gene_type:complete
MSITSDSLGRFLPRFLRERYALGADVKPGFEEWTISGALVFVDVVGFTGKVERLVAGGPEGVELANELIENSIGQLIAELTAEGGDVVVFGGDALFVLWPATSIEADLSGAINRASSAALNALKKHNARSQADTPLMRFSLGAGAFAAHRVGGEFGRWQCLLSGPAFEQVGRADALAQNNMLIVSPEAWALADGCITVSRSGDGILQVRSCKPIRHASTSAFAHPRECPESLALAHVSEPVHHNLNQLDSNWLAEFRRPSVIFARLPGLLHNGILDGRNAHVAARTVQQVVARHEGTILQFVVDDKGPVFIIAFGLLARVHEDDASRAALASMDIVDALSRRNISCGVGVATGRVFCSLIGNDHRSHYTLIGHTMNFAARLMQNAAPGPLCDQLTRDLSKDRVNYVLEGLIEVKGLEAAATHFRAGSKRSASNERRKRAANRAPVYGRDPELDILNSRLNALVSQRRGGLMALIGEAGIGKTRLVREVVARGEALSVISLTASAESGDTAPQTRWVPVVRQLLTLSRDTESGVAAMLDPYLQRFLGQPLAEVPETDDAERALRTRDAICRLITSTAQRSPMLLCIEDTHWMDSLSWALLSRLAQEASDSESGLLLLISTRELDASAPPDVLKQLSSVGMHQIALGPLPDSDRARVAQQAIGATSLSERATQWIANSSGGNPLFCRELAAAAIDSGRLFLQGGQADLISQQAEQSSMARLPDTLNGVIASRLDRLDPKAQISLRIAAVIGVSFGLDALLNLHPDDESSAREQLGLLTERGFISAVEDDDAAEYKFHHALIRDAAYDSLPYRRRRELHARFAQWLEDQPHSHPTHHLAELARNWELAENWPEAFEARIKAGDAALTTFSNREAAQHFSSARSLRGRSASLQGHAHAWAPELGLAQAHHRMGDERASRRYIEEALRAFGEFIPGSTSGRVWALMRELVLRGLRLTRRAPGHLRDPERLRMAVKAYDLLPDILYYDNDPLALAYTTLRFERLSGAENLGSPEQARAIAWYALLQSGMGREKTTMRTFNAAIEAADATRDSGVSAWVRLARGSALAQGSRWTDSERWLRDALNRYDSMGDRTRAWNVMSALGHVMAYRGQLADGAEILNTALERNTDTDNPLFLAWGSAGLAGVMLRSGNAKDPQAVLRLLRRARESLTARPDAAADLFTRGLHGAALDRAGEHDQAFDLVRETIEVAMSKAPLVWLQVSSYLCIEEVLRSAATQTSRHQDAIRLLGMTARSMRGFSRLIPIGRPALALIEARREVLIGRKERARKHLRTGLEQAVRMGLALEIGKIHLALAEIDTPTQASAELQNAVEIFRRIGAATYLEQAQHQQLSLKRADSAAAL